MDMMDVRTSIQFPLTDAIFVERGERLLKSRLNSWQHVRLAIEDEVVWLYAQIPKTLRLDKAKRSLLSALRYVFGAVWDDLIHQATETLRILPPEEETSGVKKQQIHLDGSGRRRRVLRSGRTTQKSASTGGSPAMRNRRRQMLIRRSCLRWQLRHKSVALKHIDNTIPKVEDATDSEIVANEESAEERGTQLRTNCIFARPTCKKAAMVKSSSTHKPWRVSANAITEFLAPGFDGRSDHSSVWAPQLEVLDRFDWASVPVDFGIGVVLGRSGSGKSLFLKGLASHLGISTYSEINFEKNKSVCSHPGFNNPETGASEAIDRLDAVGLNNIPSRLKPAHVLSNGEKSRVCLALRCFTSGVVLDDFAAFVDDQGASSMATCLSKQVARLNLSKVLIGTSKRSILRFLQPDFVILADSGEIHINPTPHEARKPTVSFDSTSVFFNGETGRDTQSGWNGDMDDQPLVPERTAEELGSASRSFVVSHELMEAYEVSVEVESDSICESVANAFEYEFSGTIPCNLFKVKNRHVEPFADFALGVVVGPSGCGKTTLLRSFGKEIKLNWNKTSAVASHIYNDLKCHEGALSQIAALLDAVALPVAIALRPFHCLSEGERARAEIGRRLVRGGVIDEFTSCLDRCTARTVCLGVARYIRKYGCPSPVVLATVHEDVVPALFADWVIFAKIGAVVTFEGQAPTAAHIDAAADKLGLTQHALQDDFSTSSLLSPPRIVLVARPLTWDRTVIAWNDVFKMHHYLTSGLTKSMQAIALAFRCDSMLVAFHAIAIQPGTPPYTAPKAFREHRLVVLPDWQGFGIGPRLSELVGELIIDAGYRFYSKTAHPRLGAARTHSKLWKPTTVNLVSSNRSMRGKRFNAIHPGAENSKKARVCFSHQFLGVGGHGNANVFDSERAQSSSKRNLQEKPNEVEPENEALQTEDWAQQFEQFEFN